ncbi:hypothetical protein KAS08_01445 [Candidatus Pacearchaeota archaeon]|nr:hypothetical protein [Candidatus Pacearchaeota archaeon]
MKHRLSITLILLGMFLVTQFIGLFVVNTYAPTEQTIVNITTGEAEILLVGGELPYGLETPETDPTPNFISIVFSFVLAFAIIFILMKYKWKMVIRIWFFFVVCLALSIAINAFLSFTPLVNASIYALCLAVPLSALKIFKPNVYAHNLTELLIYPGIAAVFVPILTPMSIIGLLILISFYDMWAVWKSGIMQKMAKFQMEEIKIFGGFLLPSVSKKVKKEISNVKQKYKDKKIPKKIRERKYKVNLAILGGGDVIFPIITSGVFMRAYGLIPALLIIFGAFLGLGFLFIITKKGKAYPAMPYISVGIFLGMLIGKLFFF